MKRRGFTLVELIIAVGIIALLAAVAIIAINPNKRIGQANDAQRNADLVAIAKALEFYVGDNSALPSDFVAANIGENHKVVLCSSVSRLTCDGQERDCLLIDDSDFLGSYLFDLPVDPTKTLNTDTGYYITRASSDTISFGACSSYQATNIEIVVNVELATYTTTCGDGETEGDEVCDDSNTTTETQTCGNNDREYGTYCNADCSASITLTEACDDGDTNTEGCGNSIQEIGTYCNADCTLEFDLNESCDSGLQTECSSMSGYYDDNYTHAAAVCKSPAKLIGIACNGTCTGCESICNPF